jgi:hypothetical protein
MLTPRQEAVVKLASYRAADRDQFDAFVSDAVAGRDLSDKEVRCLVDEGLAIARRFAVLLKDQFE